LSRREFLQYGQAAALGFLPGGLGWPISSFASASQSSGAEPEYHLHPKYRKNRPIEAVLQKVEARSDHFPTEIFSDRIEAVLGSWRSDLLESPQKTASLERAIGANFSAASPKADGKPRGKNDGSLQAWRIEFRAGPSLDRSAFLTEWKAALALFAKLITVEFQIVGIHAEAVPSGGNVPVRTRVRYEFVGTGGDFHREQWVGHLDLDWLLGTEVQLTKWTNVEETRVRSLVPIFEDQSAAAFGRCASYAAQFLPGIDYWRTVLDGASGIDIYGHNGVAVGDFDGDGMDDLYICQPAGLPNRMYRNRGDGTFEDVTDSSGTSLLDNCACALFADIDNDGKQDLIVVRAGGPVLFLNQGNGKFRLQPGAFQFANPPQGTFTGAAIADYDRDGWLDIYFCLYSYYQGADQYRYPMPYYAAENGPPNFLFKNNRDRTFRDVTKETRLDQNNTRFSFCCAWSDDNGDGWPDLYVVNDFGRKNLYRNNGDGTFTDMAKQAGVEDVGAGMSVSWLDYDGDGRQDLYVADMWTAAGLRVSTQEKFQQNAPEGVRALYHRHAMGNCLYRNQGNGRFEDVGAASGTLVGRWAWSSDAWDFNHDGYPEIYIANGMISGPQNSDLNSFFWRQVVANSPQNSQPSAAYEQGWNAINELVRADGTWSGYERNTLYLNHGDGTFSDVSGAAGMDFPEDSRTFARADFDGDGRVEMVLKSRSAPQLRYLKNVMPQLPPSISIRLTGKKSNRDAIGAQVTLECGPMRQTQMLQAGSGFLAQHSKELLFGLGDFTGKVSATIRWPSGLVQLVDDLPPNHRIWTEEGSPVVRKEPFSEAFDPAKRKIATNSILPEQWPTQVETWLLVPAAAPDFSFSQSQGSARSISQFRGKPSLLYFTSSRVPGYEKQMDELAVLLEKTGGLGLRMVVLLADDQANASSEKPPTPRSQRPFPIDKASIDTLGVYNLLFGRLFDRHRDMGLPTAFLLDASGDIVKIYQGALSSARVAEDAGQVPKTGGERLRRALPFPGMSDTYDFSRNYLSFGAVFFERGYLEQSEAYFRLAQKDDPDGAEAFYGLGSVYLEQQKNAEARECFLRASRAESNYPGTLPNTWNNLGILSARDGETGEAITYFEKSLQLNPENAVALQNLGNAYRQKKDWPSAKSVLERALTLRPDDAETNYSLGMVYAQTDDAGRAYEYLQKALAAKPAYPEALNNLGVLYLRTQHPADAVKSFEEAIRVAPDYDPAYLNLARLYAIQGDKAQARATLQKLLAMHPDNVPAKKALEELSR
jgi:tetratricopeptide (TPR) repeat protein